MKKQDVPVWDGKYSRRDFMAVAATTAGGAALTGCSSVFSGEKG